MVAVVVEEDWTSTVNSTPSASPAKGLATPENSSSPSPPRSPVSASALMALLMVSIETRKPNSRSAM